MSLQLILSPFDIDKIQEDPCTFLVLGHLLEAILEEFEENAFVDPLDIATTAFGLGFSPAEKFLDEGPDLLFQMMISTDPIYKTF